MWWEYNYPYKGITVTNPHSIVVIRAASLNLCLVGSFAALSFSEILYCTSQNIVFIAKLRRVLYINIAEWWWDVYCLYKVFHSDYLYTPSLWSSYTSYTSRCNPWKRLAYILYFYKSLKHFFVSSSRIPIENLCVWCRFWRWIRLRLFR